VEQADPQVRLQRLYLVADGGGGDVQFPGRQAETEVAGRTLEGADGVEWGRGQKSVLMVKNNSSIVQKSSFVDHLIRSYSAVKS